MAAIYAKRVVGSYASGWLQKADESYSALSGIMHSLKRHTARKASRLLGRQGPFWQREWDDHIVRDEAEWARIRRYAVNNPLMAGLVDDWREWPWTYCRVEP